MVLYDGVPSYPDSYLRLVNEYIKRVGLYNLSNSKANLKERAVNVVRFNSPINDSRSNAS